MIWVFVIVLILAFGYFFFQGSVAGFRVGRRRHNSSAERFLQIMDELFTDWSSGNVKKEDK